MSISVNGRSYPAGAFELGANKIAARSLDTFPQGKQPSASDTAESNRMFQKAMEDLSSPQNNSLADNAPEKAIKQVMVNGRLVATIYESGVATITSAFADSLKKLALPTTHSDQLAAIRAEMIAKAIGGEVKDVAQFKPSSFPPSSRRFSVNA